MFRPPTQASTRPASAFAEAFSAGDSTTTTDDGESKAQVRKPLNLDESMDTGDSHGVGGSVVKATSRRSSGTMATGHSTLHSPRLSPVHSEAMLHGARPNAEGAAGESSGFDYHFDNPAQATAGHGGPHGAAAAARRSHRASVVSHAGGWDSIRTLPPPEMPTWAQDSDSDGGGGGDVGGGGGGGGGGGNDAGHQRPASRGRRRRSSLGHGSKSEDIGGLPSAARTFDQVSRAEAGVHGPQHHHHRPGPSHQAAAAGGDSKQREVGALLLHSHRPGSGPAKGRGLSRNGRRSVVGSVEAGNRPGSSSGHLSPRVRSPVPSVSPVLAGRRASSHGHSSVGVSGGDAAASSAYAHSHGRDGRPLSAARTRHPMTPIVLPDAPTHGPRPRSAVPAVAAADATGGRRSSASSSSPSTSPRTRRRGPTAYAKPRVVADPFARGRAASDPVRAAGVGEGGARPRRFVHGEVDGDAAVRASAPSAAAVRRQGGGFVAAMGADLFASEI